MHCNGSPRNSSIGCEQINTNVGETIHRDLASCGYGELHFGWGVRHELTHLLQSHFPLARNVLLICGSRGLLETDAYSDLRKQLQTDNRRAIHFFQIRSGEPTVDSVDNAVQQARKHACDLVISLGGGAAIDTAKAVSALYPAPIAKSVRSYLEGVGDGATIEWQPIPTIAIPTTAGTGAEVTKNAVLQCPNPLVKKSLRHPDLVPSLAIVDPEFTVSCPREVTAHSGMDAITQCVEAFVSCRATAQTRAWALTGLSLGLRSLSTAISFPMDRGARTDLSACATYSGYALAYGGLGMAHGVAAALGAVCNLRHGLACAILLPISITANLRTARKPYDELAEALEFEQAEVLLDAIQSLSEKLQIPSRLGDVGVKESQIEQLVELSFGNSMSGNPVPIRPDELRVILHASL